MSFLSPNIAIGTLRIGSIEGASAVNVGNNFPTGFQSFKKLNQGFGSISGDHNNIKELYSQLTDSKIIDMLNEVDQLHELPEWLQLLIIEKVNEFEVT
ncbi:MAG TPA: hypothetical protein GX497_12460 [Bacillus bacterium]|nr:hypothetical protein [Bacillus sp. (in: firmicutes)]